MFFGSNFLNSPVRRVIFCGRSKHGDKVEDLLAAASLLRANGIEVFLEEKIAGQFAAVREHGFTVCRLPDMKDMDMAFVLGGDGTFLRAARYFAPLGVPLVGINLGYLGYLTDVGSEEMQEILPRIVAGEYSLEERFMLSLAIRPNSGSEKTDYSPAINDVVISRGEGGLLLSLRVFINGVFAYELRADGLIISTPSGSTAYALAAGGPIVSHDLNAVLLVPLCAHALTHRPLVVNADYAVSVEIIKSHAAVLHIDGQEGVELSAGDTIVVSRHVCPLRLCHPLSYDYYDTLRRKLNWGK